MLIWLGIYSIFALLAPPLVKKIGRRAFLVLALVPFASFMWVLSHTSNVLVGKYPMENYRWIPQLGFDFSFRLDTLSWLLAGIVSAVGSLVLIYSSRYFSKTAQGLPRFAGVFVGFAGAMFGLVTTDNTIALYLFWELTTVFSFLLIGHSHTRQPSRRAAMQAITITTAGGLAMLVGICMLGMAKGGSFTLSTLLSSQNLAELFISNPGGYIQIAIALVLLGAITKSAQFPFHFWLPAAMAAPTPVSAYLHAAAMVKAGIYLVARLAAGFCHLPTWQVITIGLGLVTMLFGALAALKQTDLKLLAAYGTVSQLGFLMAILGYPNEAMGLAGLTLLLSHAMFKATLFLTVGIIDRSIGTRDLREFSGLGKQMPSLALVATFAVLSMAGVPITIGYLGKEALIHSLILQSTPMGWLTLLAITSGSALTLAYGLRFIWGAFASKANIAPNESVTNSRLLTFPPIILGTTSVLVGFFPHVVQKNLSPALHRLPGEKGHLSLWSGFNLTLVITCLILLSGVEIFYLIGKKYRPITEKSTAHKITAARMYRMTIRYLNRLAANVTAITQRGSLPLYLMVMLVVASFSPLISALILKPKISYNFRWADSLTQTAIVAIICVAALLTARSRRRMKAVLGLTFVGYGIAVLFACQGAPDLALTQAVSETISLIVLILVMRMMPSHFSNRPWSSIRWLQIAISIIGGLCIAALVFIAAGARVHKPVTVDYPQEVYEFGYGKNIVNVTLADTRAWDTIGEISVLLAAATGVASLLFIRRRSFKTFELAHQLVKANASPSVWSSEQKFDNAELLIRTRKDPKGKGSVVAKRASSRGRTWLAATSTLSPTRRSLVFEVGARAIFPALLVFSLFMLFSGHNNPGGGFAGGVVAGIGFAIRYLAGGRFELAVAAPISPGKILGAGMITATSAALAPVLIGGTILQTAVVNLQLPIFNEVHLATALFFDVGVYLIVIGLVLDILRALGSEIDRQAELEGIHPPDLSPRSGRTADDDPSQNRPSAQLEDATDPVADLAADLQLATNKLGEAR